ncbi:MAG: DUF6484 domain-containing protein [Methylococcaceae bacterium]|nr:DUF6484 domain-containing protein [Methylococcaceae bacterium]
MNDSEQIQQQVKHIDGVIIGLLIGFNQNSEPLIAYPGNTEETAVPARSTTQLDESLLGKEIAILFEQGDPSRPLIIGFIQHPERKPVLEVDSVTANLDGEHIVLSAEKDITLKCGKASITLTRAGKILIRGAYLSTHSSGVNRIRGGTVHIN